MHSCSKKNLERRITTMNSPASLLHYLNYRRHCLLDFWCAEKHFIQHIYIIKTNTEISSANSFNLPAPIFFKSSRLNRSCPRALLKLGVTRASLLLCSLAGWFIHGDDERKAEAQSGPGLIIVDISTMELSLMP
jgi:hypothetical protein